MPSKKLELLRKLSHQPANANDQELYQDSESYRLNDRGFCLIATANPEAMFEFALEKKLPAFTKELSSSLFGDNGPLATFSQKLAMSRALGIIGPITWENMKIVRHIRNAFAHAKAHLTFQTHEIAINCSDLKIIQAFDDGFDFDDYEDAPRQKFEDVCNTTSILLAMHSGGTLSIDSKAAQYFLDRVRRGPLP